MKLFILANEIHLRDKIIVVDVDTKEETTLTVRSIRKIDNEKVLVTVENGTIHRYKWDSRIYIERER